MATLCLWAVFPAGCLSLVACWPCFQRKWTPRLKTTPFTEDASAPSDTKEETGPPMFICRVRPTHRHNLTHVTIYGPLFDPICPLSTSDHPEEEFAELLEEMLSVARAHGVVLTPQEEFHLSLSQTVVLRHHWIQPFMQSLKAGLVHSKRFA